MDRALLGKAQQAAVGRIDFIMQVQAVALRRQLCAQQFQVEPTIGLGETITLAAHGLDVDTGPTCTFDHVVHAGTRNVQGQGNFLARTELMRR